MDRLNGQSSCLSFAAVCLLCFGNGTSDAVPISIDGSLNPTKPETVEEQVESRVYAVKDAESQFGKVDVRVARELRSLGWTYALYGDSDPKYHAYLKKAEPVYIRACAIYQAQWERSYNLRPFSRRSALYNRLSHPRRRLDRDPILARIGISGPMDVVV